MNFAMKVLLLVLAGASIASADVSALKVSCSGYAVSEVPALRGRLAIRIASASNDDSKNKRQDYINGVRTLLEAVSRTYQTDRYLVYTGTQSVLYIDLATINPDGSHPAKTDVATPRGEYTSEALKCVLDPIHPRIVAE